MNCIKIFLAVAFAVAAQITIASAQISAEIEKATVEIKRLPESDLLYLRRAKLYEKRSRLGDGKELTNRSEDNRKAYDDATTALRLNPLNFRALGFRGTLSSNDYLSSQEDQMKAAEMKSKSNIVAELFLKDNQYSEMIVVRGDAVNKIGAETLAKAKEVALKSKGGDVIIFDKQMKSYFVYQCFLSYYSHFDAKTAETSERKTLDFQLDFGAFGDELKPIDFDFASLKLNFDRHLMLLKDPWDRYNVWNEVVDIVDAKGLSVITNNRFLQPGDIGWRQIMNGEITEKRYDEALAIYQHLEKISLANKDQESVKRIRKENLTKLYFASEKLRPFVEKEMTKWKYAEADRIAVRGTKP